MFGRFILELSHAAKLAHIGEAIENPRKLSMGRHMRLKIYEVVLTVDAAGKILSEKVHASFAQGSGVLTHCDGMKVYNRENAIVVILQLNPAFESTEVVAYGDAACGLNT